MKRTAKITDRPGNVPENKRWGRIYLKAVQHHYSRCPQDTLTSSQHGDRDYDKDRLYEIWKNKSAKGDLLGSCPILVHNWKWQVLYWILTHSFPPPFLKHTPRSHIPPKKPTLLLNRKTDMRTQTWRSYRFQWRLLQGICRTNDILALLYESGDLFIKITYRTVGHPTSRSITSLCNILGPDSLLLLMENNNVPSRYLSSPPPLQAYIQGLDFIWLHLHVGPFVGNWNSTGIEWHCWNKTIKRQIYLFKLTISFRNLGIIRSIWEESTVPCVLHTTLQTRGLAEGKRSNLHQHHSITLSLCVSKQASCFGLERALLLWATAKTNSPAEIISTKPSAPSSSSWDCSPSATEAQSTLCVQKLLVNHSMDQAEPVTRQKADKRTWRVCIQQSNITHNTNKATSAFRTDPKQSELFWENE